MAHDHECVIYQRNKAATGNGKIEPHLKNIKSTAKRGRENAGRLVDSFQHIIDDLERAAVVQRTDYLEAIAALRKMVLAFGEGVEGDAKGKALEAAYRVYEKYLINHTGGKK